MCCTDASDVLLAGFCAGYNNRGGFLNHGCAFKGSTFSIIYSETSDS